jgi:hypothetical protein
MMRFLVRIARSGYPREAARAIAKIDSIRKPRAPGVHRADRFPFLFCEREVRAIVTRTGFSSTPFRQARRSFEVAIFARPPRFDGCSQDMCRRGGAPEVKFLDDFSARKRVSPAEEKWKFKRESQKSP